jgi:predicted short-subunit dehydrogenase-like oxidoreductase (DUF2520 family)
MKDAICVIGAGNMSDFLCRSFIEKGWPIDSVLVRDPLKAQEQLPEAVKEKVQTLNPALLFQIRSKLIFLAVSDHSIETLSDTLVLREDQALIHTSGAIAITALQHKRKGVFYPLQTLTRGRDLALYDTPILIEGGDSQTADKLLELGKSISKQVKLVSSQERLQYHLAAVFVSNFVNDLYYIAQEALAKEKLPMELLHPLMKETLAKAIDLGPWNAQTGPAIRKDEITLNRHRRLIKDDQVREIYDLLTAHIQNRDTWDGSKS